MAMYDSEGNYYPTTPEEIAAAQAQQQQAQIQQLLRVHAETPWWNQQLAGLGYTNSENTFHGMFDPASSQRAYDIFTGTPGGTEQKMEALSREFGQGPAIQWALNSGLADPNAVRSTGVGIADSQAMANSGSGFLGQYVGPLIKPAIGVGGAILGGLAAAPYLGVGAAAPAVGDAAAATGVAGTGGASGGAFTGGLTGAATGTPGLTGAALGAPGLAAAPVAGTALAPSFFAAETLAPVALGGAGLSGVGTAGAVGAAPASTVEPIVSTFAPTTAATNPMTGALLTGTAAAGGSFLSNPAILGAAGGALLGSGLLGGGTKTGTIQTEEGIPDWLMPYVKPQLDRYATDVQNYQIDPYGIMPSAMQGFKDTISGMYLDPSTNKHLEDYYRMGAERVKGALSPSFGHMQAFGSHTGYNEALSKGLSELATGLYGGAYEKERDRQNQMIGAAPQFLAQSSTQAFAPYQQYLGTVGSLGKKKQEPYFESPFGNIMGGAMMGGAFGSFFK